MLKFLGESNVAPYKFVFMWSVGDRYSSYFSAVIGIPKERIFVHMHRRETGRQQWTMRWFKAPYFQVY